jgi:Cu+-exporting ATPase
MSTTTKETQIRSDDSEVCLVHVSGMTNVKCISRIEQYLMKEEGIHNVSISLLKEKAEIKYNPEYLIPSQIASIINSAGYSAKILDKDDNSHIETVELFIEGMTCASCVYKVEREIKKLKG